MRLTTRDASGLSFGPPPRRAVELSRDGRLLWSYDGTVPETNELGLPIEPAADDEPVLDDDDGS